MIRSTYLELLNTPVSNLGRGLQACGHKGHTWRSDFPQLFHLERSSTQALGKLGGSTFLGSNLLGPPMGTPLLTGLNTEPFGCANKGKT
jgi:hypothetical protein